MNQRLFFLFPDREHVLRVVNELAEQGFDTRQMHALAGKGRSARGLPVSSAHQSSDFAGRLEFWLWRMNLASFFIAAALLVVMIFVQAGLWMMLPLAIMVTTFMLGERFTRLPNAHLSEFHDALKHGEILLMIDLPRERVDEVEHRVQHRHPEALAGGSSWNTPALGT